MGVSFNQDDSVNLAFSVRPNRMGSIIIYDIKDGKKAAHIELSSDYRLGDLYCANLSGFDYHKYTYALYDGYHIFTDPYSKSVKGSERWGKHKLTTKFTDVYAKYDWENDRLPELCYEDCVMYMLHVRGFTRHSSSNVKNRGTFEGIIEKIPYLKELGINQIKLLPAYEFNEVIEDKSITELSSKLPKDSPEYLELSALTKGEEKNPKINYWGFSDEALYFCPKAAYSASKDAAISFKNLVKALHKENIELIMQFYFPKEISTAFILDVLKYWAYEYHVDGFHVCHERLAQSMIVKDAQLTGVKLLFQEFCPETLDDERVRSRRNLSLLSDDFMVSARRFLKSDEDMLKGFTNLLRLNSSQYAVINYIDNYYGFTLMDLVSYERKHNDSNGENNSDGSDYNFSWNCGQEGKSRKKSVLQLRKKQIFNILTFLFLGAGVPMLLMGDEFGNSQNGNNNAYCQDNITTWLDWNNLNTNKDIYRHVKSLIDLRKNMSVLRDNKPKSMINSSINGLPEISYHSEMAWYAGFENYNRHIGIFYTAKDEYLFACINMYWDSKSFALPKLPKGYEFVKIMDSESGFLSETEAGIKDSLIVNGRSIVLLKGIVSRGVGRK